MYHEITQPYGLLYNLGPALKPGARRDCRRIRAKISLDRLDGGNAYLAIFAAPYVASRVPPEAIVPCKSP